MKNTLPKSLKKKHTPFIVLMLGGAIGAVLLLFRKHLPGLAIGLKNKYLVIAGVFGSMAGALFLIIRAVRFLIRLYP